MPIRVSVRDEGEGGLCEHCKHSTKMQGRTPRGSVVTKFRCTAFMEPFVLAMEVQKCGAYQRRGTPSLYEMKEAAWLLMGERNKTAGFVHPNKIDKDARRDLLDQVPHPDYRDGNG